MRSLISKLAPTQWVALLFGIWFIFNAIVVFSINPSFSTDMPVHHWCGIVVNGWHGIFHLVPGVAGILVFRRQKASTIYCYLVGIIYIAAGISGFIEGGNLFFGLGVIDTQGNITHLVEGLIALTAIAVQSRLESRAVAAS